ncbi:hypothetical protein [Streptosporangium sp. H16]|uniref:hypothetical protein n=1 Tax=Streptosporangium sp. H16 TaxID=3444184 RepID=UPI003F7A5178
MLINELLKAITDGRVTPRDASIWAAAFGFKPLSTSKAEIAAQHGVGVRQVSNIAKKVDQILKTAGRAAKTLPPLPKTEGPLLPLVAAEIDLSDHRYADDGRQAVETLKSIMEERPIARRGDTVPTPATSRVRQHRMRRSINSRLHLLNQNPDLSVAASHLVVPWALPSSLVDLVPLEQRRRGRPPDEDWVAQLSKNVEQSYARKDGNARDLAHLALWSFSRFPQSPFPGIEAQTLMNVALMARERGAMYCYWIYRRVRYLVGATHPVSLFLTADAAITLRNHGYTLAANRLLEAMLEVTEGANVANEARLLAQWRILDQLTFNYSRSPRTQATPSTAARFADRLLECSDALGAQAHRSQALRRVFGVEFAHALLRSINNRERFWLHSKGWDAFAAADSFSSSETEEPIYRAQWNLERMILGIMLRDADQTIESGSRFLCTLEKHPWIKTDHPNESYGYRLYRSRAVRLFPKISDLLDPMSVDNG